MIVSHYSATRKRQLYTVSKTKWFGYNSCAELLEEVCASAEWPVKTTFDKSSPMLSPSGIIVYQHLRWRTLCNRQRLTLLQVQRCHDAARRCSNDTNDCIDVLNLDGCLWNEEAIESLSRSLGHFQCKVKKLHLAGDSLTHALEDNGCTIVAKGLQTNTSLMYLDVTNQQISDFGMNEILHARKPLSYIIAKNNCITQDTIKVLSNYISKYVSAEKMLYVDLRGNFIKNSELLSYNNAIVLTGTQRP
ncbi:hypothetical protein SeMB42_g05231 [Synchytrium endobioticum]|uniref:Uncharacterized protein n=1 Tax=Synchytrium endobioticum TaxID=286115 RepID=A0A507CST9_9FUNG|nr:hypothetical protein SeMB42_g05231 [Synchytrium endobioticum]